MPSLVVRGIVQMWNMKTGMSKPKEAYILTVEGKDVKLVVSFISGKCTTFLLSNNVKNVVHRSFGETQNFLHVTFQNNNFLFVEGLTSRDAEKLKTFLATICQRQLKPSSNPGRNREVLRAAIPQQKIIKKSIHSVSEKLKRRLLDSGEKNGTPVLQGLPVLIPKSSAQTYQELPEKQGEKRKRTVHSDSKMNRKNPDDESSSKSKKSKRSPMEQRRKKEKKEAKSKNEGQGERSRPLLSLESLESPCLDGAGHFRSLFEKIYLAFLLEPNIDEDDELEWEGLEITLELYPEKIWHGLPNLGNTCYMNAILQSLLSVLSFVDDLLHQGFPRGKIPLDVLSLRLAQLLVLKDTYNNKVKRNLLENLKEAVSEVAVIFSGNIQNDAHEFLGHCLDQLKESMRKLKVTMKAKMESEKKGSDQQALPGNAAIQIPICPVVANFEFELLRSITCKACGHVVFKTELSNYLSMNLPRGSKTRPLSVQSTLDLFLGAEDLEYRCEVCKHKRSFGVHKFLKIPRVFIIHLKRYNLTEYWSLRKDQRAVVIPKYLNVSSHCNEGTIAPSPLNEYVHTRDIQVLKIFQRMNSEALHLQMLSKRMRSKSTDSRASPSESNKESTLPKSPVFPTRSSRDQQPANLENVSIASGLKTTSTNTHDGTSIAEATNVMTDGKNIPFPLMFEDENISSSSQATDLTEVYLEGVPEHASSETYLETDGSIDIDIESVDENTEEFYGDNFPQRAEENHQTERARNHEKSLQEALLQTVPNLSAQGHMEDFGRHTEEFSLQEASTSSQGASCSYPSSASVSKSEKTKTEAEKQKRSAEMDDPYSYRLIGIISHLGDDLNSGHYVTDAYDFERQVWFTYNDMTVLHVEEFPMQEARVCTGYIFFYMNSKTFEEVAQRVEKSSIHKSTKDPPPPPPPPPPPTPTQ
ncbi:ubiquitin carboxyl-terminal hydrolase 26 [Sorex fumeus]|uniref:ubiquitin carboxyl-terminal hydrolase 26 n=1 Tax=Sorex fumeus TaxID=62283 RepID=UPI0024ACACA3|nr:ubiquitin carboxyl-terminal hydrolase 26 [Sorex fumeus]